MTVGSLFSGIGGIDLGLERAGMRVVWLCETDEFCRRVLARHWPGVPIYGDVAELFSDSARLEHKGAAPANGGESSTRLPQPAKVDVLCGGFPCQPFSAAGKRRGVADERWLWPAFARAIGELRPRYVLVENVPGLLARHGGMGRVVGDLAELGYDAEWDRVFAASFGAPHLRERVLIVAYPYGEGELQQGGAVEQERGRAGDSGGATLADIDPSSRNRSRPAAETMARPGAIERPGRRGGLRGEVQDADRSPVLTRRLWWGTPQADSAEWWAAEPDVGRVAHGVPSRLDRLAALGNAVVPQVAEWIGGQIMTASNQDQGRDSA